MKKVIGFLGIVLSCLLISHVSALEEFKLSNKYVSYFKDVNNNESIESDSLITVLSETEMEFSYKNSKNYYEHTKGTYQIENEKLTYTVTNCMSENSSEWVQKADGTCTTENAQLVFTIDKDKNAIVLMDSEFHDLDEGLMFNTSNDNEINVWKDFANLISKEMPQEFVDTEIFMTFYTNSLEIVFNDEEYIKKLGESTPSYVIEFGYNNGILSYVSKEEGKITKAIGLDYNIMKVIPLYLGELKGYNEDNLQCYLTHLENPTLEKDGIYIKTNNELTKNISEYVTYYEAFQIDLINGVKSYNDSQDYISMYKKEEKESTVSNPKTGVYKFMGGLSLVGIVAVCVYFNMRHKTNFPQI